MAALPFQSTQSNETETGWQFLLPGNDRAQNSITAIVEDIYGQLVLGSKNGLIIYNGYEIVYHLHDNTEHSLPSNFIRTLTVLPDGLILIGSDPGGISIYDPVTGIISRPFWLPEEYRSAGIWDSYLDSKNFLWIAGAEGVFKSSTVYSSGSVSFEKIRQKQSDGFTTIAISEFSNGQIWFGTLRYGLHYYDEPSNMLVKAVASSENGRILSDAWIWKIIETKDGILIGTQDHSLFLVPLSDSAEMFLESGIEHIRLSDYRVLELLEDSKGRIWAGTWLGLSVIQTGPDPAKWISFDRPQGMDNPEPVAVLSIYEDRAGNVWFGLEHKGLMMLPKTREPFSLPLYNDPQKEVSEIYETWDGGIILGTIFDGIKFFDGNFQKDVRFSEVEGTFPCSHIRAIEKLSESSIMIGCWPGLYVLDLITGKITSLSKEEPLSAAEIVTIHITNDNAIWLGTWNHGALRISAEGRVYEQFTTDNSGFKNNRINAIVEDPLGNLWFGSANSGLYKMEAGTDSIVVANLVEGSGFNTSDMFITHLLIFGDTLLVASNNAGIGIISLSDGTFRRITASDGLPTNFVVSLMDTDEDHIWASTNRGLAYLDLNGDVIKVLTKKDGLPDHDFVASSVRKLKNGTILFGSSQTVVAIKPGQPETNTYMPPVIFSDLRVFNQKILPDRPAPGTKEIKLTYDQNMVTFVAASVNYHKPWNNRYKYRLINFDDNWIDAGLDRTITYTNLNPGSYTLEVLGSNNDGIWSESPATIRITVVPPFWMTFWFRSLIVLVLILISISIYNYRVNQLRAIDKLRIQIASDLHDQVGASLSNIALQTGLLQYDSISGKVRHGLKKIEDISRATINDMSDIIWAIDARKDTAEELASRIRDMGFNIAGDLQIQINYEIHLDRPEEILPLKTRKNLMLIFREALNNAVKHSKATAINVVLLIGKQILLRISDNGTGFDHSAIRHGSGLLNMKMRADEINAVLVISSDNGTTIKCSL